MDREVTETQLSYSVTRVIKVVWPPPLFNKYQADVKIGKQDKVQPQHGTTQNEAIRCI